MEDQHIRILNLEDSVIDADLVARELKRANLDFSVSRVDTEPAFRDAIETSDPDVILADYNLPGFDGIAALKIARSLVPDTPFIFVSGSIGEERATQALREGATDYVIKDRLSRLPAAVTRALDEKRERLLRQRAQKAVARSDERFHFAARAALEVIWDVDFATGRFSFNEALRTVWGHMLPGDEIELQWWIDRIHPEDRDAVVKSFGAAVASDERWSSEYRFQRGDGSYGYALDRAVIVRDGEGQVRRMIGAVLDITEQRKADRRVRESELRFRSVAETAGDAIILADADGKIVFWNSEAGRLFGYERDEILGRFIELLMPERCRAALNESMEHLRATGQARLAGGVLEIDGLRKDGSEFPLEISLTVWESGGETFCTALIRDVTARVVADRRQRLQFAMARTLAEAASAGDVVPRLLQNCVSELRWQAGLCWRYDHDREGLRCTDVWLAPDFAGDEFIEMSRTVVQRLGEGLPGLVSLTSRAIAADNLQLHDGKQFVRAEAARKAGIRYGVAFPIVEHGAVTAVIEFFKTRSAVNDQPFLDLLTDAGRRVGEFFERRKSEERLFQSEASLAEAQEMAKLGTFSLDVASGRTEWSDQTHRIFGLEPGQFAGTFEAYLARVHPDDAGFVRRATTPPLKDLAIVFRHRIIGPNGEIRFLHCRVRVVAGTAQLPEKLVGTVQDVTDQVESEETIRRLSHQNEMILNYAGEGILGIDIADGVMFANPAAAAFTGWSVEELRASPSVHELIHHSRNGGDVYPEEDCPISQCLRDGTARSGEETFWKKSGEPFPAQYTCTPIVESSRVTGAVLVFDDVAERKRLERQLEQANRVSGLGRVAATIAHEFNNVLMGIQPFAEVISRRNHDEKTLKAAAQIVNSVTRGRRVTQEILRFTQPSEPELQPIPTAGWLKNLLPELQGLAGPSVEIALVLPPREVVVRGDAAQLQQVVANLVLNAADAMGGKGVVTIEVNDSANGKRFSFGRIPASLALISVRDTGSGMTPEVLANIFEPLFTTKRTGTGLGLAVAQQVIQRHSGSIHAESKPGQGTTFFILLPTAAADVSAAPAPGKEPLKSHLQRVVLVEDEPAVATGITLLLELEGVSVRVAERGSQALEAIEGFDPDAVILDMSLPDMRGTEVYETITARYPALPVLFSSGHGDESSVERYYGNERVAFLRKPYDLAALMEALDKITQPMQRPA